MGAPKERPSIRHHHRLDRVDVRQIVRGKKSTANTSYRLAPTGKWSRGREEVGNFCGFLCRGIGARPVLFQMGVFVAPGATTFTQILRGARSAAMDHAIETSPPFVAA